MGATPNGAAPGPRVFVAIALLSAALIAFQLALMQLFSLVQWHHYAWLVISIALTGFGASGSLFALFRDRMLAARVWMFPALASICAVLIVVCTAAALQSSAGFDPFLLFAEPSHVWRLVRTCLLLFFPFLPGALLLVLAFAAWPGRMGVLYLSNLGGSAAGGLLAVGLPWLLEPAAIPAAVALLAVAAAALLLPVKPGMRHLLPLSALLICTWFVIHPVEAELSEFKSLRQALDLPDARVTVSANTPYGMLHVVSAPSLRTAPGVSLVFAGEIPVRDAVFRNGMMVGALARLESDGHGKHSGTDTGTVGFDPADSAEMAGRVSMLDYSTQALPYALREPRRVLILDAGSGESVAHALGRGVQDVIALQPDGGLARLLRGALAEENDSLFFHPSLRILQRSARSMLAMDGEEYDLIVHPMVESMGGSSGLRALQEEYTLTLESFAAMWRRLSPDGCVAVTVWMDYPWRSTLRLAATLAEALRREGKDPVEHIAAVRSWGTLTFVMSRSPLQETAANRVRDFCERMSFDPALLPGLRAHEREHYHHIGADGFFEAIDRLLGPEHEAFASAYPFRIVPTTDDKPFFSQFLTVRSIEAIMRESGRFGIPAMELGTITVFAAVITIVVMSLLLIVVPLLFRRAQGRGRGWVLAHFAAIGIGFMFVEILLLHHLMRYFGNPVHAAAAVMGTLLLSAGLGSLASDRLRRRFDARSRKALFVACASVAVTISAVFLLLPPVLTATMQASIAGKVFFAVLLIFPSGFLMGMPFPIGIGVLGEHAPALIPWAWAINGCFSVVSTGAATLIALHAGFTVLLLAAAGMYATAALAAFLHPASPS